MILLIAALLSTGAAASRAPVEFSGKVVGVHDGDTFTILHEGKAKKIRVNGIDCPELGQPFGRSAREHLSKLIFGRVVTVRVFGRDQYGRAIGDAALAEDGSLSREMVRAGLAWQYQEHSRDADLAALEKEARASRRGLWADARPVAPWEWRRAAREASRGAASGAAGAAAGAAPRTQAAGAAGSPTRTPRPDL